MPSEADFRMFLVKLSFKMSDEDRKIFVFLLGDDIPRSMKDALLVDIFDKLIDRGLISEEDGSYLEEKFKAARLVALAFDVARFYSGN